MKHTHCSVRIDHPTQKCHSSPLGGTDTDKQTKAPSCACLCLSDSKPSNVHQ